MTFWTFYVQIYIHVDQLYMAMLLWYLVKRDLSKSYPVQQCTLLYTIRHFLQGTRTIWPCLSGQVVVIHSGFIQEKKHFLEPNSQMFISAKIILNLHRFWLKQTLLYPLYFPYIIGIPVSFSTKEHKDTREDVFIFLKNNQRQVEINFIIIFFSGKFVQEIFLVTKNLHQVFKILCKL